MIGNRFQRSIMEEESVTYRTRRTVKNWASLKGLTSFLVVLHMPCQSALTYLFYQLLCICIMLSIIAFPHALWPTIASCVLSRLLYYNLLDLSSRSFFYKSLFLLRRIIWNELVCRLIVLQPFLKFNYFVLKIVHIIYCLIECSTEIAIRRSFLCCVASWPVQIDATQFRMDNNWLD